VTSPDLLIVVLNYRTPALTIDCLASLADKQAELPNGFHVLLVDNGSGDGSDDQLAAAIATRGWADWVTLMPLAENRGFAGGNNAALELLKTTYATVPFALLLNSDTIVHPNALRHCHAVMTADPKIGVTSCQLQSPDGSVQNATRMFPTPLKQALCAFGLPWVWPSRFAWADIYDVPDTLLHTKRDAEWLCGAFMFLRTEALKQIGGGLDESFFFYGEDIELCFRFHRHGWRVHYDPAAAITHIGGSSSDPTRVASRLKNVYTWQARYRIQTVCYGRTASAFVRACDVTALALRKAKLLLAGKRRTDRYRDVSDALSLLLRPLRTS
jgi:N-acetylglucosaminyl-diphospho-decaprenol L-rhamnosyltransferase